MKRRAYYSTRIACVIHALISSATCEATLLSCKHLLAIVFVGFCHASQCSSQPRAHGMSLEHFPCNFESGRRFAGSVRVTLAYGKSAYESANIVQAFPFRDYM